MTRYRVKADEKNKKVPRHPPTFALKSIGGKDTLKRNYLECAAERTGITDTQIKKRR